MNSISHTRMANQKKGTWVGLLYNIDFTVSALIIIIMLFSHYFRSGKTTAQGSRAFPIIMAYVFALSAFDVLDVVVLSTSSIPQSVCLAIASAYMVMEITTAFLFLFFIPLLINKTTDREKKRLLLLVLPAAFCAFCILFVNPTTGAFFQIGSDPHYYVLGPYERVFSLSNAFYISAALVIFTKNRKRIDSYKSMSVSLILLVAIAAVILQSVFWTYRLTAFAFTLIIVELYMSYQIPEKRFDELTGLYGKHAFSVEVRKMLKHRWREECCMVYCNIKEFKAVNELQGMSKGDRILAGIAHGLASGISDQAVIGRLQSDHFAFCVPKSQLNLDSLISHTDKARMKRLFGCEICIEFGIYEIQENGEPIDTMLDRARLALEKISNSYTERYAFYDKASGTSFLANHRISETMEESLADGRFEVYLQPIVNLTNRRIVGAEALVRWNHPIEGLLSPAVFIPVFERNGLITKLDRFVWSSACATLRAWIDSGTPVVPLSMNISRADLTEDLSETITEMVDSYELPHELVLFEITESVYAEQTETLLQVIDDFHKQGFMVLLDDFGTGYSSLSLLENAPFDRMKIDRSFISSAVQNPRTQTVLQSTINLADALGLSVVTEGVETEEQAQLMRAMGSQYAQGFLYARPMPIAEFEQKLAEVPIPKEERDCE